MEHKIIMNAKYIVILLLFLMFAQGLISATFKSRTTDELGGHLLPGYHYLTEGRWEIAIGNPPLTSTLAAIPLLFVKDKTKLNFNRLSQEDYIYGRKESFPRSILLISRLIPMIFMIILGLFVFLWARDLYGVKAGIFALFLYSFSPNILSFGTIVTTEISSTFFMIASMYTFWKYINKPTKKNLIIVSIFFSLAQITKFTSLFLIPIFILYCTIVYFFKDFNVNFLLKIKNKNLKKLSDLALSLLIIFLAGLFIINAAYLFDGSFTPLNKYNKEGFMSSTFKDLYENKLVNWIPIPLPKAYVLGHDEARWQVKDEVRAFFFLGKIGESFKSYFIVHLLIKTPIALFVLLILGFIYFRKITLSEIYIAIYIISLMIYLTLFTKLLIGYRYFLPIYPLFFILSSRVLQNGIPKGKIIKLIIIFSAAWYMISSLMVFPHYLAYFNEFIGGPKNGYKYTIDSNLDWEQDLDLVKRYLSKTKEDVWVDPGCQPVTGKVLVPANSLQFQKWVCYQWLKQNFEPVDYIGYSWLVYDVKGRWVQTDQGYMFIKE